MQWLKFNNLPTYPYYLHGEYLSKDLLSILEFPEDIICNVEELTKRHFYWLNGIQHPYQYESDVIVFGLQVHNNPNEQFIMYITPESIFLYFYKLDVDESISKGKAEINKEYINKSKTLNKMASPNYIKDENLRKQVIEGVQEGLKELEEKWNEYQTWEKVGNDNWYRRLYEGPFEYSDVDTVIDIARLLLNSAKVHWGTESITMIGINTK